MIYVAWINDSVVQRCMMGINKLSVVPFADDILLCGPSKSSTNFIFIRFLFLYIISDIGLKYIKKKKR